MSTDRFIHLSDAPASIVIICPHCPNRRGVYNRDKAIATHGDIGLPDFLATVATSQCTAASPINNRPCQSRYSPETLEQLPR